MHSPFVRPTFLNLSYFMLVLGKVVNYGLYRLWLCQEKFFFFHSFYTTKRTAFFMDSMGVKCEIKYGVEVLEPHYLENKHFGF